VSADPITANVADVVARGEADALRRDKYGDRWTLVHHFDAFAHRGWAFLGDCIDR
jgi:hypothetical protein